MGVTHPVERARVAIKNAAGLLKSLCGPDDSIWQAMDAELREAAADLENMMREYTDAELDAICGKGRENIHAG